MNFNFKNATSEKGSRFLGSRLFCPESQRNHVATEFKVPRNQNQLMSNWGIRFASTIISSGEFEAVFFWFLQEFSRRGFSNIRKDSRTEVLDIDFCWLQTEYFSDSCNISKEAPLCLEIVYIMPHPVQGGVLITCCFSFFTQHVTRFRRSFASKHWKIRVVSNHHIGYLAKDSKRRIQIRCSVWWVSSHALVRKVFASTVKWVLLQSWFDTKSIMS